MFVSLNKKFIYTIAIFFLFTATLFLWTFYTVYGVQIQEEQKSTFLRNQQFIELLNENIHMRKEFRDLSKQNPEIKNSFDKDNVFISDTLDDKQVNELSKEKKRVEDLIKNYNSRYNALQEGLRIVLACSLLITLSILLLWFLIRKWIVNPINHLSFVSNKVSEGNLSIRVNLKDQRIFRDELDKLSITFNQMLENLENNVKEIKSKENFLQSLIDNIPDGIRVIDDDYNVIIANKEYYNQIGCEGLCNLQKCYKDSQNFQEPCPERLFTCPLNEIKTKNAKNVKVVQQFCNSPNRHLAINAAPMYLTTQEKDDKLYIVESIRDLSDDIKFSHQQKLSSLGFLATSVAHEMKNHLGSIRMIIEGLLEKYYKEKPDNDEEKQYLKLINNQLIECIRVPERLLKLSQYSQDDFQDVNCIDSIKEVIALLDYEAKKNGIIINSSMSKENILIKGSDADFKMIIINLALNAFKAMPHGGVLDISIKEHKNEKVTIIMIDNGIGIAKDKINRIFEPFYSSEKNSNKGTGLGLSIVKSIVEKFSGTINVSSQENQGTRFELTFQASDGK